MTKIESSLVSKTIASASLIIAKLLTKKLKVCSYIIFPYVLQCTKTSIPDRWAKNTKL